MTLQFNITNQHIIRADNEEPVAESKNYLYAHFDFLSNEWDGIEKSAIFSNGEETYTVLLQNDEVLVPWELIHEGIIEVSCFGGDLVTTNTAKIRVLASGYTEGETPHPPTPDVYNFILETLKRLNTTIKYDGSGDKYLADNGIYKEISSSIEHIKVNGIEQSITDKTVNINVPAIPENISAFNNDAGYLTEHQSLNDYVKKTSYATDTVGGVIKLGYGLVLTQDGKTVGTVNSKQSYQTWDNRLLMSKGTIENLKTKSTDASPVYDDVSFPTTAFVKKYTAGYLDKALSNLSQEGKEVIKSIVREVLNENA